MSHNKAALERLKATLIRTKTQTSTHDSGDLHVKTTLDSIRGGVSRPGVLGASAAAERKAVPPLPPQPLLPTTDHAADDGSAARMRCEQQQHHHQQHSTAGRKKLASASHADNDAYMRRFEDALSLMASTAAAAGTGGQQQQQQQQPRAAAVKPQRLQHAERPPQQPLPLPLPPLPSQAWRSGPTGGASRRCELSDRPLLCSALRWAPVTAAAGAAGAASKTTRTAAAAAAAAATPALAPPIEVAFGGADHAVYTMCARTAARRRTLFSRAAGHREWVTGVAWLPSNGAGGDGGGAGCRLLSGGMDGALWLWAEAGVAGSQVAAHAGPISRVRVVAPTHHARRPLLALSASYDKTVRVWGVGTTGTRAAPHGTMAGAAAPILELEVAPDGGSGGGSGVQAAAGDRGGHLYLWQIGEAGGGSSGSRSSSSSSSSMVGNECAGQLPVWSCRGAHTGHVTALAWAHAAAGDGSSSSSDGGGDNGGGQRLLILSGGQDGAVCAWDPRARGALPAMRSTPHASTQGRGAVAAIAALSGGDSAVVTTGADKTLAALDVRMGLAPRGRPLALPDFPYAFTAVRPAAAQAGGGGGGGSIAVVGCGDGTIIAADVGGGAVRELWRAAACRSGAVRTLDAASAALVAGCDDGAAVVFDFGPPA